jgi:hypothetical protein
LRDGSLKPAAAHDLPVGWLFRFAKRGETVAIGIAPGQVSAPLAKARDEKAIIKEGAGYTLKN